MISKNFFPNEEDRNFLRQLSGNALPQYVKMAETILEYPDAAGHFKDSVNNLTQQIRSSSSSIIEVSKFIEEVYVDLQNEQSNKAPEKKYLRQGEVLSSEGNWGSVYYSVDSSEFQLSSMKIPQSNKQIRVVLKDQIDPSTGKYKFFDIDVSLTPSSKKGTEAVDSDSEGELLPRNMVLRYGKNTETCEYSNITKSISKILEDEKSSNIEKENDKKKKKETGEKDKTSELIEKLKQFNAKQAEDIAQREFYDQLLQVEKYRDILSEEDKKILDNKDFSDDNLKRLNELSIIAPLYKEHLKKSEDFKSFIQSINDELWISLAEEKAFTEKEKSNYIADFERNYKIEFEKDNRDKIEESMTKIISLHKDLEQKIYEIDVRLKDKKYYDSVNKTIKNKRSENNIIEKASQKYEAIQQRKKIEAATKLIEEANFAIDNAWKDRDEYEIKPIKEAIGKLQNSVDQEDQAVVINSFIDQLNNEINYLAEKIKQEKKQKETFNKMQRGVDKELLEKAEYLIKQYRQIINNRIGALFGTKKGYDFTSVLFTEADEIVVKIKSITEDLPLNDTKRTSLQDVVRELQNTLAKIEKERNNNVRESQIEKDFEKFKDSARQIISQTQSLLSDRSHNIKNDFIQQVNDLISDLQKYLLKTDLSPDEKKDFYSNVYKLESYKKEIKSARKKYTKKSDSSIHENNESDKKNDSKEGEYYTEFELVDDKQYKEHYEVNEKDNEYDILDHQKFLESALGLGFNEINQIVEDNTPNKFIPLSTQEFENIIDAFLTKKIKIPSKTLYNGDKPSEKVILFFLLTENKDAFTSITIADKSRDISKELQNPDIDFDSDIFQGIVKTYVTQEIFDLLNKKG